MGIFRFETPFSGVRGNGGFSTPTPSFPDFGDFDPCTGSGGSQDKVGCKIVLRMDVLH